METVENQETALQWFLGWSAISPFALWVREEKAQGCRSRMQRNPGRRSPPVMCLPSCTLRLGQTFSQALKHGNFSLKCGDAMWGIVQNLWLRFVCLFLQKMLGKNMDGRKKTKEISQGI